LMKQRKQLSQATNYYQQTSIVWAYFIKKKRRFDCL
jgi:hypothetical protein